MSDIFSEDYRDPELSQRIIGEINDRSKRPIRLMEVCGTHTMAIFKTGIRTLLPETITLLSGPGCPVCVTAQKEIDMFIALSRQDDVIITTFGDLMRVPGSDSSLHRERAKGRDIRMVYSAADALDIARENPDKQVVFLGVGFETTAPTIAASIHIAKASGVKNYAVLCAHKLVPPALETLAKMKAARIDGFILPGHVSVIIGTEGYRPFFEQYRIPSVITGFEPIDILESIRILVEQIETNRPVLINNYQRVVSRNGNQKAQQILHNVFATVEGDWRGIGRISDSGLKIRTAYEAFDAQKRFTINIPEVSGPKGCACGEVLTGMKTPPDCILYKKVCTPINPVGPCMVSSEGTCAAYYRYHADSS